MDAIKRVHLTGSMGVSSSTCWGGLDKGRERLGEYLLLELQRLGLGGLSVHALTFAAMWEYFDNVVAKSGGMRLPTSADETGTGIFTPQFLHLLNKAFEALHWALQAAKRRSRCPFTRSVTTIVLCSAHLDVFTEKNGKVERLPGAADHVPTPFMDRLLKSANHLHGQSYM